MRVSGERPELGRPGGRADDEPFSGTRLVRPRGVPSLHVYTGRAGIVEPRSFSATGSSGCRLPRLPLVRERARRVWSTYAMKIGVSTFMTDEGIRPAQLARALEMRGFDSLFAHTAQPR
jgi:hypothetical protein